MGFSPTKLVCHFLSSKMTRFLAPTAFSNTAQVLGSRSPFADRSATLASQSRNPRLLLSNAVGVADKKLGARDNCVANPKNSKDLTAQARALRFRWLLHHQWASI